MQKRKKLNASKVIKRKSKTDYESEKTIYTSEDCSSCPYKRSCTKENNCKTSLEDRVKNLETSKLFNRQRKNSLERIMSKEGCKLRMNRCIQAEGSFGELKQDMGFLRCLCGEKRMSKQKVYFCQWHII